MALKLEVAQTMLLDAVRALPPEAIRLEECWRRVLAEDVISGLDFPPFDRSPLDGYAVIAAEVEKASPDKPVYLCEIENVPAGQVPRKAVTEGNATRIMTGAPIPKGATGVIRLEDVETGDGQVKILDGRGASGNICYKGEEIRLGERVLTAGTVLNAGAMGMLAVMGKEHPAVFKKPQVALIATGNEIIPVGEALRPGKIRNSNSYMLSAQVLDVGGQVSFMGTAPDDAQAILDMLEGAPDSDIYITTGGASVGDYDLIGAVFQKLGVTILFERISIKPGMPVVAGMKGTKLYLGLSGNPAAASVSFEQLVRPVIAKMSGRSEWWRAVVQAVLATPYKKETKAKRFVWSRCWQKGKQLLVEPVGGLQGSGMVKAAVAANSLLIIPEESPPLAAGTEVEVMLLIDIYF